jgi:hypothetical protein
MHTFVIAFRPHGWTVQMGCAMSAPCKSRTMAIRQAERMAASLRRHGEKVAIVLEPVPNDAPPPQASAARMRSAKLVSRAR